CSSGAATGTGRRAGPRPRPGGRPSAGASAGRASRPAPPSRAWRSGPDRPAQTWNVLDMGENIDLRPAGEIEQRPAGEEIEAGLGEFHPALADQPLVEALLELVEIAHVGSGIFLLRIAELGRAPVGRLLLLRNLGGEKLADQLLQPLPVG